LQGTDIVLSTAGAAVPDSQPASPAYGALLPAQPSNYGTPPVFPAPAPPGPYAPFLPIPFLPVNVNGTWALYVYDTTDTNRGVIAGGWTLHYDTTAFITESQSGVRVPATGTGPGVAATYPITFDLTSVPAGVPATNVSIRVLMNHTYPDDLHLVL